MTEEQGIRFAGTARQAWADLVRASLHSEDTERMIADIARWTRTNAKGVKVKVLAIRSAVECGLTTDEVVELGQSECLSRYAKAKRASRASDPDRVLTFRIPRSLADAIQNEHPSPDQEEALLTRLARVCDLQTSEDLFDFLLSFFGDIPNDILRQHAGVIHERTRTRGRAQRVQS